MFKKLIFFLVLAGGCVALGIYIEKKGLLDSMLTPERIGVPVEEKKVEGSKAPAEKNTVSARFTWQLTDLGTDTMTGAPLTRVTLKDATTGKSHDLGIQSGSCSVIEKTAWKLVEHETTGIICWWAGGGVELGVFQEGDLLRVKTGVLEEATAETPGSRGNFKVMLSL